MAESLPRKSRRSSSSSASRPVAPAPDGSAPLILALACVAALWIASAFSFSNWVWGVNALSHLPRALAYALLAGISLGFVPPAARRVQTWIAALGERWSGLAGDVIVCGAIGVLLFCLRDPLRLTGDFGLRWGLVGMESPSSQLRGLMFPADSILNFYLPRAIATFGVPVTQALQAVGALMGASFALVVCRFVRASGGRGAALVAAFLAACSGALLTHFAGYDKFGPLLLGIALAALGARRLSVSGSGAWMLAVGTSLALLSHRSAFLLLPAVGWVAWRALLTARDAASRRPVWIAGTFVLLTAAGVFPMAFDAVWNIDRLKHLPGGSVSAARGLTELPAYVLEPINLLNALLYLVPLLPVGLVALAARGSPAKGSPRPRFGLGPAAALALLPFLAMLVVVTPGGGWARDWDVATGAGALLALLVASGVVRAARLGSLRFTAPTTTLSLALATAIWTLHASETAALHRIATLAEARPQWSAASRSWMFDFWGLHDLRRGRPLTAASRIERAIEVGGPNPRLFYELGLAREAGGDRTAARAAFLRAAAGQPNAPTTWVALSRLALGGGDSALARAYLDTARAKSAAAR